MNMQKRVGKLICGSRLKAGMMQQELAFKAKTHQANISRLERGMQNPSLEFLERVAKCLGKTLEIRLK